MSVVDIASLERLLLDMLQCGVSIRILPRSVSGYQGWEKEAGQQVNDRADDLWISRRRVRAAEDSDYREALRVLVLSRQVHVGYQADGSVHYRAVQYKPDHRRQRRNGQGPAGKGPAATAE